MTLTLFRFPFRAMGSTCQVQLYCENATTAREISDLVISDVRRLEERYSRYRPDSLLAAINRSAHQGGSIAIDPETEALMKYADTCHQQSGGLFDITSGVLREACDFKSGMIPQPIRIERLLERIGWHKVTLEPGRISFGAAGMELDLGGIVKEYAVDRAAAICLRQGLRHGLVDLGGDIRIIGPHADGRPWSVGIRHPRKPGRLMASVQVGHGAVASSGDYERCILLDGQRYSHIFNPKTGWPVRGFASVTVIAEQCVVAGSATTIAMLKEEEGAGWLKELGVAHLWMDQNGKTGGNLSCPQSPANLDYS